MNDTSTVSAAAPMPLSKIFVEDIFFISLQLETISNDTSPFSLGPIKKQKPDSDDLSYSIVELPISPPIELPLPPPEPPSKSEETTHTSQAKPNQNA